MISADDRITRTTITANDRGPHSIGFHVLDKNEFAVFVKDSEGAITTYTVDTHFTTASIPGASGTFTFLDSVTVPAGDMVVYGVEELTQLLTSPMSDAAHERNYDKLIKLLQQHDEEINRAWKLPRESTDTDVEVPEVAVADAGKVLGVSSAGALALLSSITGVDLTMSSIGEDIATAADASAVRTLLGLVLGTDIYSKAAMDTLLADYLKVTSGVFALGSNLISKTPKTIYCSGAVADVGNTTAETTILTVTVPASQMGTNGKIHARMLLLMNYDAGGEALSLRFKLGATTMQTITLTTSAGGGITDAPLHLDYKIFNENDAAVQGDAVVLESGRTDIGLGADGFLSTIVSAQATEDTTGDLTFSITAQWDTAAAADVLEVVHGEVTLYPDA